ncbi:multicopper oxidase domain-containing protein [Brevibacillus sp. FSL K6-6036]|uniref:multicopper oxidase family protein n=1 Tax=Brevibacillus sp. FSL K6-6036 TaxID=2954682 RepID=UPI0030CDF222
MKKKVFIGAASAGIVAIAAAGAFFYGAGGETKAHAQYMAKPEILQGNGQTVRSFELVAKEAEWALSKDKNVPVWTYNGVVPGSQIRAKVGEVIRVTLKNELKVPTTIHWHGYPVPNNMDGIPGTTQNAVRPGETFTYEFPATVPGTYWYHSHQDSANQEDLGLYGTLVVEGPDQAQIQRDYTLVLDEWNTGSQGHAGMNMGEMDHGKMGSERMDHGKTNSETMNHGSMNMGGMDHGSHGNTSMPGMEHSNSQVPPGAMHDQMMQAMYTTFSVNGKTGDAIEPLEVAKGERVRLRFVNAGFQSHTLRLPGQEYKIVSADGQPIKDPAVIKDQPFTIAPGERYDIEFVESRDGDWVIESLNKTEAAKGMRIPVKVQGAGAKENSVAQAEAAPVDLTAYGQGGKGVFSLDMKYDQEYQMDLGEKMGKDGMDPVFTINGETYPDIKPLNVKKGDKVKVTMVNKGSSDHPMHLHGHFFQVLSKDGKALTGSPLVKDTLNVKPGESYVVAFEADNPGEWMFHCHDLHHAAAGMVNSVLYEGHQKFVEDPTVGNKAH